MRGLDVTRPQCYLGHATIASSYGAAGSLVVFLVWVYYTSIILLFGAELTQLYARWHGAAIEPAPHAVSLAPPAPARG